MASKPIQEDQAAKPIDLSISGRRALVACDIFSDELQAVFSPDWGEIEIVWLPVALHTNIPLLEGELEQTLTSLKSRGFDDLRVMYGACSPSIDVILGKNGAARPVHRNCMDIFLGPEIAVAESEGAIALTPGWIRAWPSIMAAMGWEDVDVRMNLGRYTRALVYDAGINPLTDDEILWFFDISELYVDIRPMNLEHLKHTLVSLLNK
jgi:hypothetical protein